MKTKIGWGLAALILCASLPAAGQTGETEMPLSLRDCIVLTLRHNLGLAAEVYTPRIADASVTLAAERFLPALNLEANKQDTSNASFSFLDASEMVTTLQNDFEASLVQQLPTGGSLTMILSGYMTDTSRRAMTINPRYGSTLRFSFSQPLLRDFGFKMGRRDIIQAQNSRDVSEQNLRTELEATLAQAETAYWNLVYSRENLEVRRQSLRLAQELLENNRAEIEAGTLPPLDILNAEADVATRQADILEAQAMVRNSEDLLKTVMNLAAARPDAALVTLAPTDSPSTEKQEIGLDEALRTATGHRSDYQASLADFRNRELNMSYARNQLLPDVRLQASYWSPGVSGDQILYEGGNALTGKVIGIIPGGGSDAMRDAFGFKYKNWSVGLTFTVPLNTVFTRAQHTQAKYQLQQSAVRLEDQRRQIELEIKTAVRAVETNYERVAAYRLARELAQRKLEAEQEKFKVGLSTNYFVLQYQRDLADAQIMELRSKVDYNVSLVNLHRAQGTGAAAAGVDLTMVGPGSGRE